MCGAAAEWVRTSICTERSVWVSVSVRVLETRVHSARGPNPPRDAAALGGKHTRSSCSSSILSHFVPTWLRLAAFNPNRTARSHGGEEVGWSTLTLHHASCGTVSPGCSHIQTERQDKWRTQEKLWCPKGGQTHPADGHNLRGEGVLVVVGAGVLVV